MLYMWFRKTKTNGGHSRDIHINTSSRCFGTYTVCFSTTNTILRIWIQPYLSHTKKGESEFMSVLSCQDNGSTFCSCLQKWFCYVFFLKNRVLCNTLILLFHFQKMKCPTNKECVVLLNKRCKQPCNQPLLAKCRSKSYS